jgi:hypothetical protein
LHTPKTHRLVVLVYDALIESEQAGSMTATDQRPIEDYIPIEAISAEARREKSVRKGHIATLHLWWARRPLVAARAAVYGALALAPTDKKQAKQAADFVADLCKYPGSPSKIVTPGVTDPTPGADRRTTVRLAMRMTRQVFTSANALANLADKAGSIEVTVEAEKADDFDPAWLRNAVLEPLEEADVRVEEQS